MIKNIKAIILFTLFALIITANAHETDNSNSRSNGMVPIKTVPPIYPINVFKKGIEGYVKMEFDVNKKGKVKNVRVVESNAEGVFDKSAIRALKKYRFTENKPANNNTQTIEFRIKKK